MRLTVRETREALEFEVADRGSARERSAGPDTMEHPFVLSERGRGLGLMRARMERVRLAFGPNGTVLSFSKRRSPTRTRVTA